MRGSLTARAAAAPGRQLFGQVRILSTADALLGTGDVVVSRVSR